MKLDSCDMAKTLQLEMQTRPEEPWGDLKDAQPIMWLLNTFSIITLDINQYNMGRKGISGVLNHVAAGS